MTIVQLEYLLAVANHGSFSLASEYCFVTQPSLSTQIKNLEDELGVILLNRNEKPICLSEAGKVVVDQASKAISSFYAISEKVKEMKTEVKGVFKIGVIPTIAPYMLHKFIYQFTQKYPDVKIQIREMFTRDIEVELKIGKIDMGLLAAGFTNPNEIAEEVLFDDTLNVYFHENSSLAKLSEVHIADIDVSSLILLPDGHCLRTQVLDLCNAKNNRQDKLYFESGSLDTIMRIVDTMSGTTIIPSMAVRMMSEDKKKQIRPFSPMINARREIALAVSKNFYKKSIYEAIKNEILINK